MKQTKSILLFHPHATPTKRFVTPLSMLAVAAPLDAAGFRVQIVDANTDPAWSRTLAGAARDALCAGITALTGYQVRCGLEGAALLRESCPGLPIVWGGYQPAIYPDQAVADPRVDAAVSGLGEMPMLEICRRLAAGSRDFDGIEGVTWRDANGEIRRNAPQKLLDINQFPSYPWHLVDLERYVQSDFTSRTLCYNTSMACPFGCAFCGVISAFPRGWTGYAAERVADEIEYLVRRHGLDGVPFLDNNYFVDRKRAGRISELLIERRLDIKWMAMGRARDFLKMDPEMIRLFKRSGCKCVFIGAESGSDEILELINKELTAGEVIACTELLTRHGITPHYSFTLGYPPEPEKDIEASLELIRKLKRINPETQMNLMYYTPYHGTPLYRWAQEQGFDEPDHFSRWSDLDLNAGAAPWMTSEMRGRVHSADMILRTAFPHEDWVKQQCGLTAPLRSLMMRLARAKWERGSFEINDLRALHRLNNLATKIATRGASNGFRRARWVSRASFRGDTAKLPA